MYYNCIQVIDRRLLDVRILLKLESLWELDKLSQLVQVVGEAFELNGQDLGQLVEDEPLVSVG